MADIDLNRIVPTSEFTSTYHRVHDMEYNSMKYKIGLTYDYVLQGFKVPTEVTVEELVAAIHKSTDIVKEVKCPENFCIVKATYSLSKLVNNHNEVIYDLDMTDIEVVSKDYEVMANAWKSGLIKWPDKKTAELSFLRDILNEVRKVMRTLPTGEDYSTMPDQYLCKIESQYMAEHKGNGTPCLLKLSLGTYYKDEITFMRIPESTIWCVGEAFLDWGSNYKILMWDLTPAEKDEVLVQVAEARKQMENARQKEMEKKYKKILDKVDWEPVTMKDCLHDPDAMDYLRTFFVENYPDRDCMSTILYQQKMISETEKVVGFILPGLDIGYVGWPQDPDDDGEVSCMVADFEFDSDIAYLVYICYY